MKKTSYVIFRRGTVFGKASLEFLRIARFKNITLDTIQIEINQR